MTARFDDAPVAVVVRWAAESTGRRGFVSADARGPVDLRVGPVPPDSGLDAAVAALQDAGFAVTLTAGSIVVRPAGADTDADLLPVADGAAPRTRCPGVASRSAIGPVLDADAFRLYGTRLTPRDGRPAGLRLSGVRPGGPVAVLGLKSGDVVESITGAVSWTPDAGARGLSEALFALLQTDAAAELVVRRRGEPTRWSCAVAPADP